MQNGHLDTETARERERSDARTSRQVRTQIGHRQPSENTSIEYRVIMQLRSTYSGESLVYHGLHGHVCHALQFVVDDQLWNELRLEEARSVKRPVSGGSLVVTHKAEHVDKGGKR